MTKLLFTGTKTSASNPVTNPLYVYSDAGISANAAGNIITIVGDITSVGIGAGLTMGNINLTPQYTQIDASVFYGYNYVVVGSNQFALWQTFTKTRSTDGTTQANVISGDELWRFNAFADGGVTGVLPEVGRMVLFVATSVTVAASTSVSIIPTNLYIYVNPATASSDQLSAALYYNGIFETLRHGLKPASFTVTAAPSPASAGAGCAIYITNGDSGNPCLGVSDGTNWRRITLGTTASAV